MAGQGQNHANISITRGGFRLTESIWPSPDKLVSLGVDRYGLPRVVCVENEGAHDHRVHFWAWVSGYEWQRYHALAAITLREQNTLFVLDQARLEDIRVDERLENRGVGTLLLRFVGLVPRLGSFSPVG